MGGVLTASVGNYPGSKLAYLLFSTAFWLMLLTAFGKRTHYGYLFLVIALWLGFWGKITAHLLLKYPYVEPVGHFDGSAAAWDGVLWVAIAASSGVILGKLLFALTGRKYSRVVDADQGRIPVWYPVARKWVWAISLTMIVGVAAINLTLGIQQIGLVPRTILLWPLNALIAFQVSIGSAFWLTALLWWEVSLKKNVSLSIYALLIEASISATTLLSRGVYLFHTIPNLFSLFENRQKLVGLSKINIAALILVFAGLMWVSISVVATYRAYLYPHKEGITTENQKRLTRLEVVVGGIARVNKLILQGESQEGHLRELLAEKAQLEKGILQHKVRNNIVVVRASSQDTLTQDGKNEATIDIVGASEKMRTIVATVALSPDCMSVYNGKLFSELYSKFSTCTLQQILSLVVDRWIGLEGVMAVSVYPEKSNSLLVDAIKEKREIGKTTKFQDICNSSYRWVDASNYQFASLPGAPAFLYFSGSLWVVFLGMAMFAFMLQLSEELVFRLTSNPLLCSLFGLTLANTIAQFGVTPRQDIPFYSMIFGLVLVVSMMQSDEVYKVICKSRLHRGGRGKI